MGTYYSQIATQALATDAAWAKPHVDSLRGRVFLIALFAEMTAAINSTREIGARVVLYERTIDDQFEMRFAGRSIGFARVGNTSRISITRGGFPRSLVPYDLVREEIEAPDHSEAPSLARQQIGMALDLLLRSL